MGKLLHKEMIMNVEPEVISDVQKRKLELAEIEKEAKDYFNKRNYNKASEVILSKIIDNEDNSEELNEREKAWYFQLAAHFLYLGDKSKSNDLQIKAASIHNGMSHPPHSSEYTKIANPGIQAANVRKNITEFSRPQDVSVYIEDILKCLQYNPDIDSDKFEDKLDILGNFLGFYSQRPEEELGDGPDVLWCMSNNLYLIMEAKSQATHDKITQENIEQILHSKEWFVEQYGDNVEYLCVTLQSPARTYDNVHPGKNTYVLDGDSLSNLKNNLRNFVGAIQNEPVNSYTTKEIAKLLRTYNLTVDLFKQKYLKNIRT